MKKGVLAGFVFLILMFNLMEVSASLEQSSSSIYYRIKLDPNGDYCWKCIDYYPTVSRLATGKLCVDDNAKPLPSTSQMRDMISNADGLTGLSNNLYNQKIIGCHMIYLKDHMGPGAILTDSDENGVLNKVDTLRGTISKEIKWDLGGKITVLYPGTAIEYKNGIWTVKPADNVAENEKSYFLFDNKKFVSSSEQTFTLSRISGAWTATPDTSTPAIGTNLMTLVSNLFRRLGGMFA